MRLVGAKKVNVESNTSELMTKAPEKRSLFDSYVSLLLTCGTFVPVKNNFRLGCSHMMDKAEGRRFQGAGTYNIHREIQGELEWFH